MKLKTITSIINVAFNYVINTSQKYNIDESHSLRHSMDVFHYANNIYESEIYINPFLKEQKNIIMCSAILHDMCDKKYIDEQEGISEMNIYMRNYIPSYDLQVINKIITSMSYSTVNKNGFPDLGLHNLAYHIVREADLLAGYDVERCIIYQMMHKSDNYVESLKLANELFKNRILLYIDQGLFYTDYSKNIARTLHNNALLKLGELNKIYDIYNI